MDYHMLQLKAVTLPRITSGDDLALASAGVFFGVSMYLGLRCYKYMT